MLRYFLKRKKIS